MCDKIEFSVNSASTCYPEKRLFAELEFANRTERIVENSDLRIANKHTFLELLK